MATRLRVAIPQCMSGGVLLSHRVAPAVPSALRVLASGFGMCPGVSLALWPPKLLPHRHRATGVVGGCVVSLATPGPGDGWSPGVGVVCSVLSFRGFRLLGTTEWTRAILGPLTRPFDE